MCGCLCWADVRFTLCVVYCLCVFVSCVLSIVGFGGSTFGFCVCGVGLGGLSFDELLGLLAC